MNAKFESKMYEFEVLCKKYKTDIEDFTDLFYKYENYKIYKKEFISSRKQYNIKFKDFKYLFNIIQEYNPIAKLEILSFGLYGKSQLPHPNASR